MRKASSASSTRAGQRAVDQLHEARQPDVPSALGVENPEGARDVRLTRSHMARPDVRAIPEGGVVPEPRVIERQRQELRRQVAAARPATHGAGST
jgi:hypothetical protein